MNRTESSASARCDRAPSAGKSRRAGGLLRASWLACIGCIGLLSWAACGRGVAANPEPEVRRRLGADGFELVTLTRGAGAPGRFTFTAYREGRYCSGTASFEGGGRNVEYTHVERCGVDEPPELARTSCTAGRATSCGRAANALRHAEPPDLAGAEPLAERGCAADDLLSCFELGYILTRPGQPESAAARAVAAYQKSCDANDGASCNNLGMLYSHGAGVARDESRACDLFERACTNSDFHACSSIADCFRNGEGRSRDPEQAHQLYTTACDHEFEPACTRLLSMKLRGEGVAADVDTAVAALQARCDATPPDKLACVALGVALHEGIPGLERDRDSARRLFERGCEAGDGASCRDLGIYQREGLGGAHRDRAAALRFFTRGCELGDEPACRQRDDAAR